jgi:hypothetical protein
MVFDFAATQKNGPLREFLAAITDVPAEGRVELGCERFAAACPPLYHHVEETQSSKETWTQSQPA